MKKKIWLILIFLTITNIYGEEILITGNAYRAPKIWLEDGQAKGILVDILHHIGKKVGVDFEIKLYVWKRAYYLAETGESGIVGISMTTERLKIFDYSDPIYYDEVVLVVKRGNEFKFDKFEDLKYKRISVVSGGSFGYEYEEAKKYFIIVDHHDNMSRLRKLLSGRVDAAIFSPGEASLNMEIKNAGNLSRDQFSILEKPLTFDPNYLAFSKELNKAEFIKKFNHALKEAYEKGEIQEIVSKY